MILMIDLGGFMGLDEYSLLGDSRGVREREV
jgi:hypothetical protein